MTTFVRRTDMTVPFRRVIVLVPLAVALSWAVAKPVSAATQPPAPSAQSMAQRETVAQEVAAALKEYHRLFSSKRADAMAERGYGAPLVTPMLSHDASKPIRCDR